MCYSMERTADEKAATLSLPLSSRSLSLSLWQLCPAAAAVVAAAAALCKIDEDTAASAVATAE